MKSDFQIRNLLLAEDNPDDAFIFKIMFNRASLPQKLHCVADGQQAIDWLNGKEPFNNRAQFPMPELLLLDLKMPIKNGFEVLEWLRSQNQVLVPAAILSSSDDSRDLHRANELGAMRYFVKSPKLNDVIQFLREHSV